MSRIEEIGPQILDCYPQNIRSETLQAMNLVFFNFHIK